jgi:hypothetical protein
MLAGYPGTRQLTTHKAAGREESMKASRIGGLALPVLALTLLLPSLAHAGSTVCRMQYSLKEWSAFYSMATGAGTITCENGQSARVTLRAKGGGLAVGRSEVVDGQGRFSEVQSIDELFGVYLAAGAQAGMVESAQAQVVTKGTVSLALSGTGKGIELGTTFGEFVIEKDTEGKKEHGHK